MEIELREWTLNEIEELIYLCNHADRTYLSDRMPYPYSHEDALWYLDYIEKNKENSIFKAIVVDGVYAGACSIEENEIGYHLLKEFHNKGIMSAVVEGLCDNAFKRLNIDKIIGLVYEPNIASKRVLEKNGFVFEGIKEKEENDNYRICVFGKCRDK